MTAAHNTLLARATVRRIWEQKVAASFRGMSIVVQGGPGLPVGISCTPQETVKSLQEKIAQQKLIYNGVTLSGNSTLNARNIRKSATLIISVNCLFGMMQNPSIIESK